MNKPIRALLLSAGLGTRLRPITLKTPKCLVQIGGEPLLGRWLRQLEQLGCEAVLINTHYLAQQVEVFLQTWDSASMSVHTVHEPYLLGTAGTLLANQKFFKGSTGLLIHSDNVMTDNLGAFLTAHQKRHARCLFTMLTFMTDTPSSCGIVEVDDHGVVNGFHEKILKPPGNRANGALYAFEQELIDHLNIMSSSPSDFSTEVIPTLLTRIQAWHTKAAYVDIGTPDSLLKAQKLISYQP